MKVLRYSLRELYKNPLTLLLLGLQSIVIYALVILAVSAVHSRFKIYDEVSNFIEKEGISIRIFSMCKPQAEGASYFMDSSTAEQYFEDVKIRSCYNVGFETTENGKDKEIITTAYDSELWKCHTPVMETGRWFFDEDEDSDVIEGVIAQEKGERGLYQVGDVIEISKDAAAMCGCEKNPLKIKIIGIIKDGARILGANDDNGNYVDVRGYFWNYSGKYYQQPFLFLTHKDIYRYKMKDAPGLPLSMKGLAFLSWDDENDSKYNLVESYLSSNCEFSNYIKFEMIRGKSFTYIFEQLKNLLPILLALIFMAIITIVSCTSILARQNMYKYAVFYINGLAWKECIHIQMLSVLILESITVVTAWCVVGILNWLGRLKEFYLLCSIWEVSGCILVFGIFVFCAYATIFRELGNKTGKEILTSRKGELL